MKKTVKFWTNTEEKMIRTCISKFQSAPTAAKWAAPRLGRTEAAVYQKILSFSKPKTSKRAKREKLQENKGVTIPAGFTFDIKPSKAVMFNDHVRLYF